MTQVIFAGPWSLGQMPASDKIAAEMGDIVLVNPLIHDHDICACPGLFFTFRYTHQLVC